MDKKTIHLLACIGEECGEVQQAVGKCLRFGLDERWVKEDKANIDALFDEVLDVMAMQEMLIDYLGLNFFYDQDKMNRKKQKVSMFLEKFDV